MGSVRVMAALLVGTAMLAAGEAGAQGRGPPAADAARRLRQPEDPAGLRAQQIAELDAWLGRLVARFQTRASFSQDPTLVASAPPQRLILDCNAIGAGSGVSCRYEATDGTIDPPPLALLFGVDPDRPGLRLLTVDSRGYARELSGLLSGDTAIFESPCIGSDCAGRLRMRIHAPPGGQSVDLYVAQNVLAPDSVRFSAPIEARTEMQRMPQSTPAPSTAPEDYELDEVLVVGRRPTRNRDSIAIWLRRLVGRFGNTGTVQIGAGGTPLPVKGATHCVAVGAGPGTSCMIMLEAPNIQTHLQPGAFILGLDLETPTIRFTSLDDTGVAVGTTGELRDDTAVFRTPCAASHARTCESTTRITARSNTGSVRLRVEIRTDDRVSARYDIEQVRLK
jgi:hypothetical protein